MYYNEAYEARQAEEEALMSKWENALELDGGIANDHLARTTAICLENYLQYLHDDPRLMAEDRIQSNAFTGVNLALLGLIARVIPNLVGAELVGIQAMPTPKSPIFTIRWEKDDTKGRSVDGEELWVTPVSGPVGLDPLYSSSVVEEEIAVADIGNFTAGQALVWGNVTKNLKSIKPFIFNNSMYLTAYDVDGNVLSDYKFEGGYDVDIATATLIAGNALESGGSGATVSFTASSRTLTASGALDSSVDGVAIGSLVIRYEYKGEGEANTPEISFAITDTTVELHRRQLRGKYTMDAAYDLKKLHGINIDMELSNMMKVELQAEINREIVSDVRMLAGITDTLDFAQFAAANSPTISGNYNDTHQLILDAINIMSAKIWTQGRLGKANWVVGNPITLAFLDRVPGFSGTGVTYNGKEMAYLGSLGGKMKFIADPNYPVGELLMGYKGPGALDAGYIHAPYLPITATPTMVNQETGDPSKTFYTRYGKTYNVEGGSVTENLILNGQYQYGRLFLKNFPTLLGGI